MDILIKAIAGVLIALVLCQILNLRDKNISVLLVIAVCCIVVTCAANYMEQIIAFIQKIEDMGQLNSQMLKLMLKAVGVCLISEIAATICVDAGNSALGKVLQILSSIVILWISMPIFSELISLVQSILEAI